MTGAATVRIDMRSAWREALLAISGLPEQWAWEGHPFTPIVGVAFARESFRPIFSRVAALGAGGTIAHRFMGGLTVIYPASAGVLAAETAAGLAVAALRPGRALTRGTCSGVITEASSAAVIVEPAWLTVPVNITLTAYTVN